MDKFIQNNLIEELKQQKIKYDNITIRIGFAMMIAKKFDKKENDYKHLYIQFEETQNRIRDLEYMINISYNNPF